MRSTVMPEGSAGHRMAHSGAGDGPPVTLELRGRLCAALADLLAYPTGGFAETAETCRALAGTLAPAAIENLDAFLAFAETSPRGHLEEAYTAFFDLNPVCSPYVGHALFGESYKRSAFLVRLTERYRSHGFEIDRTELPDRLSVVLSFMAGCRDDEEVRTLATEAVLPALERLTGGAGGDRVAPPFGSDADPQLEGHSEGEVLAPGFLLGITEPGVSDPDQHPYRQLLLVARLLLEAMWPHSQPHDEDEG